MAGLTLAVLVIWTIAAPHDDRFAAGGNPPLVLVAPTFFKSAEETRFRLTISTCEQARQLGVPIVIVDASAPEIRDKLATTGAQVLRQQRPGKKGVALREGIEFAARQVHTGAVIGFFEPEKLGMVQWMIDGAAYLLRHDLHVVIPARNDGLFATTYPVEQYHQEMFTNLLIDSMAGQHGFPRGLDWTFGPVLLRADLAHHWTQYGGALWDAQVIPFVRAVRWHGARIASLVVPYSHPKAMKLQEEFKYAWAKKRFEQLTLWASVLPAEFEATSEPQ